MCGGGRDGPTNMYTDTGGDTGGENSDWLLGWTGFLDVKRVCVLCTWWVYSCVCVCMGVMFGSKCTHCSSQGYFAGRQSTAAAAGAAAPADRTAPCSAVCRTA